jgi:hypothetical protein
MRKACLLIVLLAVGLLGLTSDAFAVWAGTKRLTWTSEDSLKPAMAIDSNNMIHVVWSEYASGSSEIYYKRSTDGGLTWSSGQRLTWMPGDSSQPAITVDSGNGIHVVWSDNTGGNSEVYYKKSTNGGLTWSSAARLTWTPGNSSYPVIATSPTSRIHVVWQDSVFSSDGSITRGAQTEAPPGTQLRLSWTEGVPGTNRAID